MSQSATITSKETKPSRNFFISPHPNKQSFLQYGDVDNLSNFLEFFYKVKELIDGGDISSLWTNERWSNDLLDRHRDVYGPQYYSQRGEDCPPRLDANKYDYLANGEEYAYIYTLNNEWVCYNRYQFEDNRMPEVVEIPVPAVV